jgi:hypothetical protein
MNPAAIAVVAVVLVGAVVWRATAVGRTRIPRIPRRTILPERRRKSRLVPPPGKPAELQIIGQDFIDIPEVRDISDNGLAISVPHRFQGEKPTQEVDLLLTLHGQGTLRARGTIRHVSYTRTNTATFGVELVDIKEEDRDKLRSYLADIQHSEPKPRSGR